MSIHTASTTRSVAPIGVITGLVALFWTAFGAHDMVELLTMCALAAVATLLVFGWLVPVILRRESVGGPALALAIPAFLLAIPAFWSGLPLILGVAAAVTGNSGRTRTRGARLSLAAMAIGILAILGYLFIYIGDGVVGGNAGFLFD